MCILGKWSKMGFLTPPPNIHQRLIKGGGCSKKKAISRWTCALCVSTETRNSPLFWTPKKGVIFGQNP